MKTKKFENIIILSLAPILIIIIVIIAYLNSIAREKNKEAIKQQARTTAESIRQQSPGSNRIVPTPLEKTQPPVEYDTIAEYKLLSKIKNRAPLKEEDKKVVLEIKYLIEPEDAEEGSVYMSPNITIFYIGEADVFQVEIKNTDIDSAKNEAVRWLTSQGLSAQAICDYPVYFYLNAQTAESLRGTGTVMNTLPPGCQ